MLFIHINSVNCTDTNTKNVLEKVWDISRLGFGLERASIYWILL